jgi:hypothetical protein
MTGIVRRVTKEHTARRGVSHPRLVVRIRQAGTKDSEIIVPGLNQRKSGPQTQQTGIDE